METIICNLAGRTKRVGEFIVAPLTLLVQGVLNGSMGPLYYPAEEIARNPSAWDGVPLTVGHPSRDGQPISATSPGVPHIGDVRNTRVSPQGKCKLTAEGWFSVNRTRAVDSRILHALETGRPIELSTGLFTQNVPASGTYNGKFFSHVARNYRPDHVAILPDQVGACSIRDGCGVLVNCGHNWFGETPMGPTVNKDDILPLPTLEDLLALNEEGERERRGRRGRRTAVTNGGVRAANDAPLIPPQIDWKTGEIV